MVKLKTATIGYFEAISARNRLSIAYFGFNIQLARNQDANEKELKNQWEWEWVRKPVIGPLRST